MGRSLLTIDWDYFMPYISKLNVSVLENKRNIDKHWYKMYLENKQKGIDITRSMKVGSIINNFWIRINEVFNISNKNKIIVSDSHKIAYKIADDYECDTVYNFDSHTDLGYGGIGSLIFEVNCANWLGKLLKDNIIANAKIILSPYSGEDKKYFEEINREYSIDYLSANEIKEKPCVDIIHICRSGAWTAPWLDNQFYKFIRDPNLEIEYTEFIERKWDIENISLSEKIEYMLFN